MLKTMIITSMAAAGLMLSAQVSAHQSDRTVRWHNSHSHSHHHQPPKFRVNKEQREQAMMIRQGIKTCQITPQEASRLYNQQNRIKRAEQRMRRDGLQKWERNKLKKRLHRARININRLTKNGKTCWHHNRHRPYGHNDHHHGSSTWNLGSGKGSISISIEH